MKHALAEAEETSGSEADRIDIAVLADRHIHHRSDFMAIGGVHGSTHDLLNHLIDRHGVGGKRLREIQASNHECSDLTSHLASRLGKGHGVVLVG